MSTILNSFKNNNTICTPEFSEDKQISISLSNSIQKEKTVSQRT